MLQFQCVYLCTFPFLKFFFTYGILNVQLSKNVQKMYTNLHSVHILTYVQIYTNILVCVKFKQQKHDR